MAWNYNAFDILFFFLFCSGFYLLIFYHCWFSSNISCSCLIKSNIPENRILSWEKYAGIINKNALKTVDNHAINECDN